VHCQLENATLLNNRTREEVCSVIWYMWAENMGPTSLDTLAVYGASADMVLWLEKLSGECLRGGGQQWPSINIKHVHDSYWWSGAGRQACIAEEVIAGIQPHIALCGMLWTSLAVKVCSRWVLILLFGQH